MYFAAESEQGIAALGLDPVAMLLQAGTFLVIFFIVKKYLLESISKTLEDRRLTIEESLDNAQQIQTEKELLEQEKEKILKEARKQAEEIIANGNKEAGSIISKAEEESEKRAQKIIERTERQIESSVSKAQKNLENEVRELVANATETILNEKLDQATDQELINKALKGAKYGA